LFIKNLYRSIGEEEGHKRKGIPPPTHYVFVHRRGGTLVDRGISPTLFYLFTLTPLYKDTYR